MKKLVQQLEKLMAKHNHNGIVSYEHRCSNMFGEYSEKHIAVLQYDMGEDDYPVIARAESKTFEHLLVFFECELIKNSNPLL